MTSPEQRSEVLLRLRDALQEDVRLAGTVLVGSGAIGFLDDESDIDVVAVVDSGHDALAVFEDWALKVPRLFPVLHRSQTPFSLSHRLHGFLLEGLLELDLSFIAISELRALHDRWQVLLDWTGSVHERMAASALPSDPDLEAYRWLFDAACYRVLQCRKALRRGQLWRAATSLDELRQMTFQIACLVHFGNTAVHRHVDDLPVDFLSGMTQTVAPVDHGSLTIALRSATLAMLDQAKELYSRLDVSYPECLAHALVDHLD